ncbi:formimidoylglutamase [Pseudofulvibacter geojedonensis]|uniref:Formimidoylglutamase n=1 Tax=Pseudofulvibacter geojedonensis TaxID=1123758 RepID=A0ABW3I343_9FLAO
MIVDFLTPVSKQVVAHALLQNDQSIGRQISFYKEKDVFPTIEKGNLVLFGVIENRNDINYLGESLSFDGIRNAFCELFPGNWQGKIVDIGNVSPGATVDDTYFAVKKLVSEIIKIGAIPVVIGGSNDLTYALYRAYDDLDQMVNLVCVDAKFDLRDVSDGIKNNNYMNSIIVNEPNNLLNYSNIGFQTYYNSQEEIDLIKKLYFDAYRLGDVCANINLVEPLTRDADIVSFDITSIQASELSQGKGYKSPNGFSGKEACAIARYAGLSNKVTSFGLFELNNNLSDSGEMLLAQILWYYIEGVNCRIIEPSFSSDSHFKKYIVPSPDMDLVFFESLVSRRWWVQLPENELENNKYKRATLISCTQEDYLVACDHQIPDRIYKAFRKSLI